MKSTYVGMDWRSHAVTVASIGINGDEESNHQPFAVRTAKATAEPWAPAPGALPTRFDGLPRTRYGVWAKR